MPIRRKLTNASKHTTIPTIEPLGRPDRLDDEDRRSVLVLMGAEIDCVERADARFLNNSIAAVSVGPHATEMLSA
jgi:hypothetical protein